jgi:hypothetical protein
LVVRCFAVPHHHGRRAWVDSRTACYKAKPICADCFYAHVQYGANARRAISCTYGGFVRPMKLDVLYWTDYRARSMPLRNGAIGYVRKIASVEEVAGWGSSIFGAQPACSGLTESSSGRLPLLFSCILQSRTNESPLLWLLLSRFVSCCFEVTICDLKPPCACKPRLAIQRARSSKEMTFLQNAVQKWEPETEHQANGRLLSPTPLGRAPSSPAVGLDRERE